MRKREFSWFQTVELTLEEIRGELDKGIHRTKVAAVLDPKKFPKAAQFLAWEMFYGNPNAVTDTLKAMQGL